MKNLFKEPILFQDYPDVDVIRVDDTFYMISTTMHFTPGGVILRSYNLIDWEIVSYVYETLDSTEAQRLENSKNIYGKGMWAASLRHYKGKFYVCFVCNDTGKTYLYRSSSIEGPWEKSEIEGFYHDCSLYFEEIDGVERVFIVYGNTDVYLTELNETLTGPKQGGINRLLVSDRGNGVSLGYEGSHFYKIDGIYYLFMIHSKPGYWLRSEACFTSDSLTDEFTGRDIYDTPGYRGAGIAQGGIVDDVLGHYFLIIFQDRGASGRIPYVLPVSINKEDVQVLGNETIYDEAISNGIPVGDLIEKGLYPYDSNPGYEYTPLSTNELLDQDGNLNKQWQWNHEPDLSLILFEKEKNGITFRTTEVTSDLAQTKNVLTQRTIEYESEMTVDIDASDMNDGDVAGLAAFMGCYSYVAIEKDTDKYYLVMRGKELSKAGDDIWKNEAPLEEFERCEIDSSIVTLKVTVKYKEKDTAIFAYKDASTGNYVKIGKEHEMAFRLDHFCGCRFGLFLYSRKRSGGKATFSCPVIS